MSSYSVPNLNKKEVLINLPFYLLPFLLFFSVITNAIGFYFFLILFPFILILANKIEIPYFVKQIGLVLFLMYACFSIANFLNFFFPSKIVPFSFYENHFSIGRLLKSRLSTVYLTSAVILFTLPFLSKKNIFRLKNQNPKTTQQFNFFSLQNVKPLESFMKGSFYAGVFFVLFFYIEYHFKIHYRDVFLRHIFLPDANLIGSINRPTGLLANPLTLSSMSLAFFTFFYAYFCCIFFGDNTTGSSLPFSSNKRQLIFYSLFTSLLFLFILFLTVARTAVFISFFALIFIPILSSSKKNRLKSFIFIFILILVGFLICNQLGYTQRILETFEKLRTQGHIDNRHYFRKIFIQMFLDKPWIGNGVHWLSQGLRDAYYVALGYANLNERNYPAHNLYLEILAAGGLFCATTLVFGVLKLRKILKENVMTAQMGNKILWVAFSSAFIVNLGHAFTQNNFLESSTTYTYFYILFVIFWDNVFRAHIKLVNNCHTTV